MFSGVLKAETYTTHSPPQGLGTRHDCCTHHLTTALTAYTRSAQHQDSVLAKKFEWLRSPHMYVAEVSLSVEDS